MALFAHLDESDVENLKPFIDAEPGPTIGTVEA